MKVADASDLDPQETQEWLEALSAVRGHRGNDRAEFVNSLLQMPALN
jgi:pyruvate dehydrogenase E1 component